MGGQQVLVGMQRGQVQAAVDAAVTAESAARNAAIAAGSGTSEPFVYPVAVHPGSVTGGAAVTANMVYLLRLPRQDKARSVMAIDLLLSSLLAGNVAGGIYTGPANLLTTAEVAAATFTRVASHTAEAIGAANTWQRLTFGAAYPWARDTDLWVGFGMTSASLIHRLPTTSFTTHHWALCVAVSASYADPLPASLTGAVATSSFVPVVAAVVS